MFVNLFDKQIEQRILMILLCKKSELHKHSEAVEVVVYLDEKDDVLRERRRNESKL